MKLIILMVLLISCANEEGIDRKNTATPPPSVPELLESSNITLTFPDVQLSFISTPSSYQIQASGGTSALVYSCDDCASGVTVDASTGLVSWNLSDEVRYSSILKVADNDGYILFKFEVENIYSFDDYCAGNSSLKSANNLISWLSTHYATTDCSVIKTSLQAQTELTITGKDKISLKPLSEFTDLESLTARNHNITSFVALTSYTKLEYLDISSNELQHIDKLSSLVSLRVVRASNNLIEKVNKLSSLVDLETLDLSENIMAELPDLSALSKLEFLDLSHNLISKFRPNSLPKSLKEIYLQANSISDLSPLLEFRDLLVLNVSANELRSLDTISELLSLRDLAIGLNPIEGLSGLSKLRNLSKLSLVALFDLKLEDIENLNKLKLLDIRLTNLECPESAALTCLSSSELRY